MRKTIVAAGIGLGLGLAAVAGAQPAPEPAAPHPAIARLSPPPGWNVDDGRSAGLEKIVAVEAHFGDVPIDASAQQLQGPPGAILQTTQIVTRSLPANPSLAAARELHGLKDVLSTATLTKWEIRPGAAERAPEARYEWHDPSLGTTTIARTIVVQAGGELQRMSAECVIADDAAAARAPCEAALETLAPIAAVADRAELAVGLDAPPPPSPEELAAKPPAPPPSAPSAPAEAKGPSMSEGNGSGVHTTTDVRLPPEKKDRRPLYVIVGVAILAAIFLWNRRERAKLDAEREREEDEREEREAKDEAKEREAKAEAKEPEAKEQAKEAEAADAEPAPPLTEKKDDPS